MRQKVLAPAASKFAELYQLYFPRQRSYLERYLTGEQQRYLENVQRGNIAVDAATAASCAPKLEELLDIVKTSVADR